MARARGTGDGSRYNIRAIERAISVLEAFSRQRSKLTLDDITRHTGLSKPTAFRIVSTLQYHRYLTLDPADGRYRLGSVFLSLGGTVMATMSLRDVARRHLDELRDDLQATVLLGVLMDDALVYVDKRETEGPVRIASDIGWRRDGPHYGMLGMTLLAHAEPEETDRILADTPLVAYTRASVTDPGTFVERLDRIREEGFVVEFGEAIEGVWGAAAPIRDASGEVAAAVGVALSMSTRSEDRVAEVVARVRNCARSISEDLGFYP